MSSVREFLLKPFRRYLRAVLDVPEVSALTNTVLYAMYRESLLSTKRNRDPKRLLASGFRGFSQHDEDGMIQEIFRRIGTSSKVFVEFGVGDGRENNTLYLLLSGWRGLWIEDSESNAVEIRQAFDEQIKSCRLLFMHEFVDRDSINRLIENQGISGEIDLMSIDVDGNEYWLWEALTVVQPRVLVVEYNAVFRPPLAVVARYNPRFKWDGTSYGGASLSALQALGVRKGYELVGCSLSGINAFFVRRDLVRESFCCPFTAENHFEPPRFGFYKVGDLDMHPAGIGKYLVNEELQKGSE